jgi:hypothetical protein
MEKETKISEVKKSPSKEIQISQEDVLIQKGLESGASVETMEKLFNLRERVFASNAKSSYVSAISSFQHDCPDVEKSKKVMNKDGKTVRYQYAPLDAIISQIKDVLLQNGLSYRWEVINTPEFITARAIITHIQGHSEQSEFQVPIDKNEYMTSPQRYASALTFAKRYALLNALGVTTTEEDTDATDVGGKEEVNSQKSRIIFLLRSLGRKTDTVEEIAKSVSEITLLSLEEKNYADIVDRLAINLKEKQENDIPTIQQ